MPRPYKVHTWYLVAGLSVCGRVLLSGAWPNRVDFKKLPDTKRCRTCAAALDLIPHPLAKPRTDWARTATVAEAQAAKLALQPILGRPDWADTMHRPKSADPNVRKWRWLLADRYAKVALKTLTQLGVPYTLLPANSTTYGPGVRYLDVRVPRHLS